MCLSAHRQEPAEWLQSSEQLCTNRSGRATKHWSVCNKQKVGGRETRGDTWRLWVHGTSYLTEGLWWILCCCGGRGHTSSWTVAKHVSSCVHSSTSIPLPVPLQPPSSHPSSHSPSWVLLRFSESPSAPSPSQGRGGKFQSVKPGCGGGVVRLQGPSPSVRWPGAVRFYTRQHKHNCVIVQYQPDSFYIHLIDRPVSHSASSLPVAVSLSLCVSLRLSAFPSDLSGHISPASLVCASCPESTTFIGRGPLTHAGTGGALLIIINQSHSGCHCSFQCEGQ